MGEETIIELFVEPEADFVHGTDTSSLRVVRLHDFASPFTLSDKEYDPYLRRMATLFVDEDRMREGSTGKVFHATNAFGEQFALKLYDVSLDREYEVHRRVSEIKGFPALYGKALMDGHPVLVMEWVEGEDLSRFAARFVIDDDGRLSPLTVARLGRDLFNVLARTNVLEGDLIHGDLSFRNVLICTVHQSFEDQVRQGSFDLRLIDMGSARFADGSSQEQGEKTRNDAPLDEPIPATPQFAAPELRADEGVGDARERSARGTVRKKPACTPAVDVYAAARILMDLLCGSDVGSITTVHASEAEIAATLLREPEVAVAVNRASSGLAPAPTSEEVMLALVQVDEMLMELLRCGLDPDPAKRPSAAQMRDALDSYCASYVDNLGHAIRGEELDSCDAPFIYKGIDRFSLHARNAIRVVGKSLSFGLLAAIIAITGILSGMNELKVDWGTFALEGFNVETLVAALLFPLIFGLLARWKHKGDRAGFVRGSAGVLAGALCVGCVISAGSFDPYPFKQLFVNAAFACSVMSWCPFVLDLVFPSASARVRRSYRALPGANEQGIADEDATTHT